MKGFITFMKLMPFIIFQEYTKSIISMHLLTSVSLAVWLITKYSNRKITSLAKPWFVTLGSLWPYMNKFKFT